FRIGSRNYWPTVGSGHSLRQLRRSWLCGIHSWPCSAAKSARAESAINFFHPDKRAFLCVDQSRDSSRSRFSLCPLCYILSGKASNPKNTEKNGNRENSEKG